MSFNVGIQCGYNVDIGTYVYRNDGIVKAVNAVNINVKTLTGTGSISGYSANIKCDTYQFNGLISCTEGCAVRAKIFEECGRIEGKRVRIICDEFKFCGNISCSEDCVIYTKKAFNHNLFERKKSGKYYVIITQNNVALCTLESLLSNIELEFTNNLLKLTDSGIEDEIKRARTCAVLNRIDDVKILEELREKVEAQAQYYKERLDEKRGEPAFLYTGAAFGGVGTLGLCSAAIALFKSHSVAIKFGIKNSGSVKIGAGVGGVVSSISLFVSYMAISEWLNPLYKEKYDKLQLVSLKIDQSLKSKRIPEEEVIILQ